MTRNYRPMRCAAFGLGLGATKEHSRQGSVTEEQQRPRPNAVQPSGRQSFFALTSLLAPHRPLAGMLVARASSARKISGRAWVENSVSQYQERGCPHPPRGPTSAAVADEGIRAPNRQLVDAPETRPEHFPCLAARDCWSSLNGLFLPEMELWGRPSECLQWCGIAVA